MNFMHIFQCYNNILYLRVGKVGTCVYDWRMRVGRMTLIRNCNKVLVIFMTIVMVE